MQENLGIGIANISGTGNYSRLYKKGADTLMSSQQISLTKMPLLSGMGLKDAVYLCENLGLKVLISGKGKVSDQSILSGQAIKRGQRIQLHFN